MSFRIILFAIVLMAISGLPGVCFARSAIRWSRIAAAAMATGAILGLFAALPFLLAEQHSQIDIPWPVAGDVVLSIDALSAFFLIPVFLMGGLGSIYGIGYWSEERHPENSGKLQFFWGLLTAGMAVLVISKHAMAFLLGWETMALAAYFLVTTEDNRDECRRAAWIYLIATHAGTLSLFAMFALWRCVTGSFLIQPVSMAVIDHGVFNTLFFLLVIGFGLKAGIMPLHFWLPGAHANAPSHVSAVLSGVVLKMGIYGLVRFLSLFPVPPVTWGFTISVLGAVSALLGVLFAISQHDLKRLLAYHSIENIGIILMGLGLAMLGRSAGRPELVVLGISGCLLHVWNHSLFKSLLFLCTGSVVHRTHTQDIDRLGGLAKIMPWTTGAFLIGSVAICGLPPLNGFISELLIYIGLLRSGITEAGSGSLAIIGVPVLALTGALAVACFVKVYGSVFLGLPRTDGASDIQESPFTMRAPMVILAGCCLIIGLFPVCVIPILNRAAACWIAAPDTVVPNLATAAPLGMVSIVSVALVCIVGCATIVLKRLSTSVPSVDTWDCGYARPDARMQYTASSFAQIIVTIFGWALRPQIHDPQLEGTFPRKTKMHSHVDDPVLDSVLLPISKRIERLFNWFHCFHQGLTQHYVLYILIAMFLMLSTLLPIDDFFMRLFVR